MKGFLFLFIKYYNDFVRPFIQLKLCSPLQARRKIFVFSSEPFMKTNTLQTNESRKELLMPAYPFL